MKQSGVKLDGSACELCLTDDGRLSWKTEDGAITESAKISEVIAAIRNPACQKSFSLHYVISQPRYLLVAKDAEFECEDADTAASWVDVISGRLKNPELKRPQKLLVFINPSSGAGRASKVYADEVAHLFKLANIDVEVIYTKDENHAGEVVKDLDLSSIDGLVAVGGDGTYNQLANALLHRTYKDAGLDLSDPECPVIKPPVRMGVIQAGSVSVICRTFAHGTTDPATAALHIILGSEVAIDTLALYKDGQFSEFNLCIYGYGWLGDMLAWAESRFMRWLGMRRYRIAMFFVMLFIYRAFRARIEFRDTKSRTTTTEGCVVEKGEWQTLEGEYRFFGLNNLGFHYKPDHEETGEQRARRLVSELNDGRMRVMLMKNCSRAEIGPAMEEFGKIYFDNEADFDSAKFPDVLDTFTATEIKLTVADPGKYTYAGSDGELRSLDSKFSIHAKVHQANLPIFARGLEMAIDS